MNETCFFANGPGLKRCEALSLTYFSVEILSKVVYTPRGTLKFQVAIKSPSGKIQKLDPEFKVNRKSCEVQFMYHEGGTNIVEVFLENKHITGSPYSVSVIPVKLTTVPRWYVFVSDKYWKPYSKKVSDQLEQNWQNNIRTLFVVTISEDNHVYNVQISFADMVEINQAKISRLFFPQKRAIRRGTWFWKTDSDTEQYAPYPTEIAERLENSLECGFFSLSNRVDVTQGKKIRHVIQFSDGSFRQYRSASDANPKGRVVLRGYKGRTIREILIPVPLRWEFSRVIWVGVYKEDKNSCFFAILPEQVILRILDYCELLPKIQIELLKKEKEIQNAMINKLLNPHSSTKYLHQYAGNIGNTGNYGNSGVHENTTVPPPDITGNTVTSKQGNTENTGNVMNAVNSSYDDQRDNEQKV